MTSERFVGGLLVGTIKAFPAADVVRVSCRRASKVYPPCLAKSIPTIVALNGLIPAAQANARSEPALRTDRKVLE